MWHGERYRRRWRSVALFLVALNAALQSRVHTSVTLGIASAPELRELANNIAPATHRAWRTTPADFEKSNYKLVPRGTSSGKREEKPGDDFASSVVPAQRWFRQYATLVPVPSRAYGPSEQHSMPGRSLRQAIVRSRRWPPTAPPPLYFFPPQRCRFSIYKVKKRKEGGVLAARVTSSNRMESHASRRETSNRDRGAPTRRPERAMPATSGCTVLHLYST